MTERSRLSVTRPSDAFGFGRNWQRYLHTYLDPERVAIARASLVDLIGDDIDGKIFVDVGAGSGLFSLCAIELGASRVVSVDVDPDSVASCRELRARIGAPENWEVLEASILDPALPELLPEADILYSWGVLHHTGSMYEAIRRAAKLVAPGGVFVIAIYNRSDARLLDSGRWLRIKRFYNHCPRPAQLGMEWLFFAYTYARILRGHRSPIRVSREYKASRGMAMKTDMVDWLGGYPYEFATADEIVQFVESEGLVPEKVLRIDPAGTGNNQFVFRRPQ